MSWFEDLFIKEAENALHQHSCSGGDSTESGGIYVTGATPGQTVKITAVDENGVPTAWKSADFPSGMGVAAQEIISEGTLDFPSDYTKNTFPVTMEKLREYKLFGIAAKPSVSANHKWIFGSTYDTYDYPGYSANSVKEITLICEWADDAKTILKVVAMSGMYVNNPFKTTGSGLTSYCVTRTCTISGSFQSVGTGNNVALQLSVAQTSEVPYCVWGVTK